MRSIKVVSRRVKSGRRHIAADGAMSTMLAGACRRSVSCAGDDRSASSSHAPHLASAGSPRRIRYGHRTHTARRTAISRPRSGRLRRRPITSAVTWDTRSNRTSHAASAISTDTIGHTWLGPTRGTGTATRFRPRDQRSEIGILAATQSIVVGGIEIVRMLSYASDASK